MTAKTQDVSVKLSEVKALIKDAVREALAADKQTREDQEALVQEAAINQESRRLMLSPTAYGQLFRISRKNGKPIPSGLNGLWDAARGQEMVDLHNQKEPEDGDEEIAAEDLPKPEATAFSPKEPSSEARKDKQKDIVYEGL